MVFQFSSGSIRVTDLERSTAFYREALGLTETACRRSASWLITWIFISPQ